MQEEILRLEGVGLSLGGQKLFKEVSVSVRQGEMLGLTGGSGCGKTSLLKLVLGFLVKDEGEVIIEGTTFTKETVYALRERMSYVPQELSFPCDTVGEMVKMPFELKANRSVLFSEERLFSDWQKLGLDKKLYTKALSKISGGQKQRIVLASAALLGKPLLLLDEPTSAIDVESVELVKKYLRGVCAEKRAVVVVTHDKRLLDACDKRMNFIELKK
ncbi:MAG: ATP-binding cassette domain-containing protein [Bacteroidaceae bacterium]